MPPEPRPVGAVAALILAAGRSLRFGSAKQLARLQGRTLLEHVVTQAAAAGLRPIVAVVPPWLDPPSVPGEPPLLVPNPAPELGVSHSLRLGLAAIPAETSAAVILLGDQPTIEAGTLSAILAARGDRPVVAAFADGHAAPPVLLERSAFGLASDLSGDVGLRELIATHPDLVRRVPVRAHAPDLDRPEDLAALAHRADGHGG